MVLLSSSVLNCALEMDLALPKRLRAWSASASASACRACACAEPPPCLCAASQSQRRIAAHQKMHPVCLGLRLPRQRLREAAPGAASLPAHSTAKQLIESFTQIFSMKGPSSGSASACAEPSHSRLLACAQHCDMSRLLLQMKMPMALPLHAMHLLEPFTQAVRVERSLFLLCQRLYGATCLPVAVQSHARHAPSMMTLAMP